MWDASSSPSLRVLKMRSSLASWCGSVAARRARGGGWAIQATRRQTARHGPTRRERVASDAKRARRIESWVLPGDFRRRVEWWHKVSSYLHLFRWSR